MFFQLLKRTLNDLPSFQISLFSLTLYVWVLKREAKERDLEAWQVVQRSFEKLKKHRKTGAGLNIWT
ncbi:conjugal transfer nickase/helicase domain-containing protein, partial [Pseudomonas syringae]|uniref:conjugal transfer nickase/helicase domain-containing protein n=1 Tax=Pseudomonas syringae TaxID=317 RepID=UPI003AF3CE09